tara:strand:+ start:2083 stop:2268 length:186 start_codon:yes stop_codon:yes gene_type:complete
MKKIEFTQNLGPGKCSKCGIFIEENVKMFVATNLTGRPSLTKEQLVMVEPEFCETCHAKLV